ncbi:plastocyanin/azurin family copper-binding protein [Halegenticoccus soli]|uniref:plastocyanin/azurin family copper-binding protein n=1 Tax=Halegenticoccus soli TaxID=1985678 RepID=UPI000C6DEE17|nr:plastocyanin/azurin family copper-binding protein [Halegenticoccus soli]
MTDGNEGLSRRAFLRSATAGTVAAGATTNAAAQEGNESSGNESGGGNESAGGNQSAGGNESGGNESGGNQSGGGGGGGTEEVIVGPGGELVFEPVDLQITPGTTVKFVWESDGHNVVPDEGDWGHEPIEDTGFEFSHTFEEEASYHYVCEPHASAGMEGNIEVTQDAGGGGGGGGGGSSVPTVPDSAKSLGVATTFAMITTLGLAYFFIKYGGDYDYEVE